MDEKEMLKIQKEIAEIVKNSAENPHAAVAKLAEIRKETARATAETSSEFYYTAAMTYEATGDIWVKVRKLTEAEKAYLDMMKMSVKLFELDKEKFDFSLGVSYYKRASFYRSAVLQCAELKPTPKELTEQQKKIFEVTESLYKKAIACTMKQNKPMPIRHVDLHANIMSELLLLYAFVGNYEKACMCGKDGVKLDKAIYEKMDDKAHSFRLANRMNALATVYTFAKNVQLTMETLEDSIFALEEHEEEDPIVFGVMLARNYMTLAGCYCQIKEESSKAEETYQIGLKRMVEVSQKANNRFINDVITSYMIVGDYYKKVKNEKAAKEYYRWAMKKASKLYEATKNPTYENIMKRLHPFV